MTSYRYITKSNKRSYAPNIIRNQKYRWYTFFFCILGQQFRFFFNTYFFCINATQLFEKYAISPLISSIGPWIMVLFFCLLKEGIDDYKRHQRDKALNSEQFLKLYYNKFYKIPSSEIKVGDIIMLEKNERVPADMVLLKTGDISGQMFIKTDQLDGETDWKMRLTIPSVQNSKLDALHNISLVIEEPHKDIYSFNGKLNFGEFPEEERYGSIYITKEEMGWEEYILQFFGRSTLKGARMVSTSNIVDEEVNGKIQASTQTDEIELSHLIQMPDEVCSETKESCIREEGPHSGENNVCLSTEGRIDGLELEKSVGIEETCDRVNYGVNAEFGDPSGTHSNDKVVIDENEALNDRMHELKRDERISMPSVNYLEEISSNFISKPSDSELNLCISKHSSTSSKHFNIVSNIRGSIPFFSKSCGSVTKYDLDPSYQTQLHDKFNPRNSVTPVSRIEPLNLENVLWMNTVVASSTALGMVIYTGCETRAQLNTLKARNKFGILDEELNTYMKFLALVGGVAAVAFALLRGATKQFEVLAVRFLILFSSAIPISLKITIDWARYVYARIINSDSKIKDCVVRSSNLPEELGRINYFLTDKTGTLTKNEMEMKKVHLGSICYTKELNLEIFKNLVSYLNNRSKSNLMFSRAKKDLSTKVYELIQGLSICHNVTPVFSDDVITYQASSPDEVAIIRWTELVGMKLIRRDRNTIEILDPLKQEQIYEILHVFPFTSETKRMGIIVRHYSKDNDNKRLCESNVYNGGRTKLNDVEELEAPETILNDASAIDKVFGHVVKEKLTQERVQNNNTLNNNTVTQGKQTNMLHKSEILLFVKGADAVMKKIVKANDWIEEETDNMARDGLRTLVIAKRILTEEEYKSWNSEFMEAKVTLHNRAEKVGKVISKIEQDMTVLGLTGVEDKLQDGVKITLENLRNAGIKIWMLTGDKIETAISIAISSRIFHKLNSYLVISNMTNKEDLRQKLELMKNYDSLVIDGISLSIVIDNFLSEFITMASKMEAVVGCRYTPTQKAIMASALKSTGKRICCIGDGGNDVSMITEAHVGIGIVGKEGNQASLAADFSIMKFCHVNDLFFWHGRNAYKSSAKIAHLVIHRGTIIAVMQGIFCALLEFAPMSLYQGAILMAYVTVYTFFPIFSVVTSNDISRDVSIKFPELYKELLDRTLLSLKDFSTWNLISFYQGTVIMLIFYIFKQEMFSICTLTFSSLIVNEQLMVMLTVSRITKGVLMACGLSLLFYMLSFFLVTDVLQVEKPWYFFVMKILCVNLVAIIVSVVQKAWIRYMSPPSHSKLKVLID